MHVASFKRWHWAILGAAIGLGISFYRGWVGPEGTLEARATLDSTEFEQLLAKKSPSGKPWMTDIRYFAREDSTDWVTAEQLIRRGRGPAVSEAYVPVKIAFDRPYKPRIGRSATAATDPNFTVIDYLKSVRAKNPDVRFSTRWWDREPLRSAVFALIGMTLLAGVCPSLMNRMTGGHARRRADGGYGQRMIARDADTTAAPARATPQSATASAPIRRLDAGPLQQPPPTQASPKPADKKFAGEFYPTETHVRREERK